MTYDFNPLKAKLKNIEEWLIKELAQVRTGRASLALLDSVQVESYGTRLPINQVANVASEDPRTLRIVPWDMSQVRALEKAIVIADLGLSVSVDDKGLRVIFPELTTDRRSALVKVAKAKLEEAKVTLRKEREETWKDIQAKEKEGGMSEDEKFRFKTEMEKVLQETILKFEGLADRKEKEIIS
jgi:ribosome recycling factor